MQLRELVRHSVGLGVESDALASIHVALGIRLCSASDTVHAHNVGPHGRARVGSDDDAALERDGRNGRPEVHWRDGTSGEGTRQPSLPMRYHAIVHACTHRHALSPFLRALQSMRSMVAYAYGLCE